MANFEAFRWTILLSTNLLFLKSDTRPRFLPLQWVGVFSFKTRVPGFLISLHLRQKKGTKSRVLKAHFQNFPLFFQDLTMKACLLKVTILKLPEQPKIITIIITTMGELQHTKRSTFVLPG